MNLLQRLKYAIESDFKVEPKAENPLARLNQYINEAEAQTNDTKKYLERQVSLKQHLEAQLTEAQEILAKREEQLQLAKQAGEQDLIVFAETEQAVYTSRVQLLSQSIHNTTNELIALEQKHEQMKHKIEDMKIRQLQLMGYENNVRANYHMDAMLNPETQKHVSTVDDMRYYIDNLQSPTQVVDPTSSLEARLNALQHEAPKQLPTLEKGE